MRSANEIAMRAKERNCQQLIPKATIVSVRLISINTDAANLRAYADSLRGAADDSAARLSANDATNNSCSADAGKAASRAAMVLADVRKRADQRADDLDMLIEAANAD